MIVDVETAPPTAQTGKFPCDPSQEWLRVGPRDEPDLAVDGLRNASLLERLFGRLLTKR